MESLVFSIDIPDLNEEISIEADNYSSSIISKDNNICLFLLTKNKKRKRNTYNRYNSILIIHIGKSKKIFINNLNKFQYLILNKNHLYLKYNAFLNYITKEKKDYKESLINNTFSFIKSNSILESDLIMALIYHSYNTKYFDDIINYADKIEKFDDELNLKDEEYINFYFNIMKEKELKENLRIKLLKMCLFYLFKIKQEKFLELFFSKEFDLNQNYKIIYDNSYLFGQWPNAFIEKSIIILERREDLIQVLYEIESFIDFLFYIEKYYDKLKIIIEDKSNYLFNNIKFNSNENENYEILNKMNNINYKINEEKDTKEYLTFFQKILFNHLNNNNKDLTILFQYINNSKNVSNNQIYILDYLKKFYIWKIGTLKGEELIQFIENNLINNIPYLPKEFNFQIILHLKFESIEKEQTIKLNEIIEIIDKYYPQNFINKFYYNEEYNIRNLTEFYNYLIYLYEYKKILFNADNYKIISGCFFHLCSITQINSDEINNLDIILKFFEAEKIFKDIFNNYNGDLTKNMALFFVLIFENKNISNDIEETILSLFKDFPIIKIFKYSKSINKPILSELGNFIPIINPIFNPILINGHITSGNISPLLIGLNLINNLNKTDLNKIDSNKIDSNKTDSNKTDILDKAITFLKSSKDGNIPYCIFEILNNSDNWLGKIKELKMKDINRLTSSLYPNYINKSKYGTIIRIKKRIFSLYENEDFQKLNKLNILNVLRNGDFLYFNKTIIYPTRKKFDSLLKEINKDRSILSNLTADEIYEINQKIILDDSDYKFFYFADNDNVDNLLYLNKNLFEKHNELLLYLTPKAINYLYNNRKEMNFFLNKKFIKEYDYDNLILLKEEVFEKVNENINDVSPNKINYILSDNKIVNYLPKKIFLSLTNENLNFGEYYNPLKILNLLYNHKYTTEICPLFFSKLITKIKLEDIHDKVKYWFLNLKLVNEKILFDNFILKEKQLIEQTFNPERFGPDLDYLINRNIDLMNYDFLKKLCLSYSDKEKIIAALKKKDSQIDDNIFGLMDKYYIKECLLIIDKDKNNKIEYYKKMRKYIVEFTKKGLDGIIEFFYKYHTLKKILEQKLFDVDFREELCEELIILIETYISSYYSSYKQNCIDFQLRINYCNVLKIYLELLEEKYGIDKVEINNYLKKKFPKETTVAQVKKNINDLPKEKIRYIDILIQIFIYAPDKTGEEKIKNIFSTIFSTVLETLVKFIGDLFCLKKITFDKTSVPSILFGAFITTKFINDFEELKNEKILLWKGEESCIELYKKKRDSYKASTLYILSKKILKKIWAIPSIPFSYFNGNLLSNYNYEDILGFKRNSINNNKIEECFQYFYNKKVNQIYFDILVSWDFGFNNFIESQIKEIKYDNNIGSSIINFYENKKKIIKLITKNRINKYKLIIEKNKLLEEGLLETVKNYFFGITKALIETPYLMIKGLFNISDFDGNKKINLKNEIEISQKKELLIEIQNNINDIIKEYNNKLKYINMEEFKYYLSFYKNGKFVFSQIKYIIQEEFSKVNKIYEECWEEKEKSIFCQYYFGLQKQLIITMKGNDNIEGWIDIELQNDFIQIDDSKNNEQEKEKDDINLVLKDEIKETKDSDLNDFIII